MYIKVKAVLLEFSKQKCTVTTDFGMILRKTGSNIAKKHTEDRSDFG